ncbi:hypothetical protein LTR17_023812 [Elasticomyces elasticus]|nr:hypothetical protein LTR17_023812 [Elasticomyces elasticus]
MTSRLDNFQGTEDQYIAYLEERIVTLQRDCRCSATVQQNARGENVCETITSAGLSHTSPSWAKRSSLSIQAWSPPILQAKRPRNENPTWRRHATELVKDIPTGKAWRQAMEQRGIYEAMNTGAAVAHLLESESVAPVATQENVVRMTAVVDGNAGRLVQLMTEYASIAAQRHQTAKLALLLANFQKFVVSSACVVLKANGAAPIDEVFTVVRICLGDVTDDHCTRMLHTVKYMNTLIDTLAAHGWDGRAAELVLYCLEPEPNILLSFSSFVEGKYRVPQDDAFATKVHVGDGDMG